MRLTTVQKRRKTRKRRRNRKKRRQIRIDWIIKRCIREQEEFAAKCITDPDLFNKDVVELDNPLRGIIIHPEDRDLVDTPKWEAHPLISEKQQRGEVTFCQFYWKNMVDISASKEDPSQANVTFECFVTKTEETAEICKGGLRFTYILESDNVHKTVETVNE